MNLGKFREQMKRLIEIYGDRSFPNAKIDAIWEIARPYSDYWFERTVTKIINTCKFAPMPSDFYEEANLERTRTRQSGIPQGLDKPHPGPMSENTITLLADWKRKNKDPGGAA